MQFPIQCPTLAHLLHAERSDDGQSRGLERRFLSMDGEVGCDAHFRDEVEIFLVAGFWISNCSAIDNHQQEKMIR